MPKFDLALTKPVMNASGTLGFVPDARGPCDLSMLGAFVTNPISLRPRVPAAPPNYQPYPGGFLLHTGYPNPGFRAAIKRYASRWAQSPLQVLVHLLASGSHATSLDELTDMVQGLEGRQGILGIEIGLPPDADAQTACAIAQAALGELPLILRLPLENALLLSRALLQNGLGDALSAVSLAPPRGALHVQNRLATGRLYGPALFPLSLATVGAIHQAGLAVIGAGGVYHQEQVQAMLSSGATAVQLDAVLWRDGWQSP
jgi:dihydroorotate dehydrogenase